MKASSNWITSQLNASSVFGLTDETLDILKQYENRIYWTSWKDKVKRMELRELNCARGEILAWINSGDMIAEQDSQRMRHASLGAALHRDLRSPLSSEH